MNNCPVQSFNFLLGLDTGSSFVVAKLSDFGLLAVIVRKASVEREKAKCEQLLSSARKHTLIWCDM